MERRRSVSPATATDRATLASPRPVSSGPSGVALPAIAALDPERADVLVIPGAVGREESGRVGIQI